MSQHYISQIDELARTAFCSGCERKVPVNRNAARSKGWICAINAREAARSHREAHRQKIREGHKAWREANPDRLRDYQLQRLYGITIKQYRKEVADRGGRCDICGRIPEGTNPNERSLCVDHVEMPDRTKLIRGYLCAGCNAGLGRFGDDPARLRQAAAYLEHRVSS